MAYLRKNLIQKDPKSKWDSYLLYGLSIPVFLIIILQAVHGSSNLINWLSDVLLGGLVYIAFTEKDFENVKSNLIGVAPLLVIYVLEDILHLILPKTFHSWSEYISTAKFFAFCWLVAIWFIGKRQSKAIALEKEKTKEKERENQITQTLKDQLEVQVAERTSEITKQKEALEEALQNLKATQAQLIQAEKMASLGELTAGIAHEIQNPLNFMNNFSELNHELIEEMKEEIRLGNTQDALQLADNLSENEQKINFHGKRADGIVKGMLQHSRTSSGHKEPTNLNALADEYLRLAYHGLRAKDKSFNATLKTYYDLELGPVNLIPQDMGRAILNLITNAFYSVQEKKNELENGYEPIVTLSTRKLLTGVEISVEDNGKGIPQNILDKIFQPFFTTKPTGQGTGLGLSLTYDIVKAQGGDLKVNTREGEGSEFIIHLPA